MMTVVIYSKEDLEPITVVKLPYSIDEIRKKFRRSIKIPVPQKIETKHISKHTTPDVCICPIVTLEFVDFIYEGMKKTFLVTDDEEFSLLLKSELLAGQRSDWFEHQFINFMMR